MNKLNATTARNEFFEIIRNATENHQIYRIQHQKGSVVLMSEEEYDSLIETLNLLRIPGFPESIRKSINQMRSGQTVSFEEVFGNAE